MIEIRSLYFAQNGQPILDGISVEIEERSITGILGPNGAGKSSFLRCLTGAEKRYTGRILFGARDLKSFSLKELAARRAVLSQHLQVAFPFTSLEIVMMGRNPTGVSDSGRDREAAHWALSKVDALHLKDRVFPSLSGGEQQRVQLARVLVQIANIEKGILFLDEPTSALDLRHQYQVLETVGSLAKERGLTVLIVLHDLNLARHFTTHTVMLNQGRVASVGKSHDILQPDLVRDVYQVNLQQIADPETGDLHLVYQHSI